MTLSALDPFTVAVTCGVLAVVVTAVFVTGVAQRHNDEANRLWAMGLFALTAAIVSFAIWSAADASDVLLGPIVATALFSVGALGCGARVMFDHHAPSRVGTLVVIVLSAGAVISLTAATVPRLAAAVACDTIAFLAIAAAWQLATSPMRTNLHARVLQLTLVVLSLAAAVVGVVSVVQGPPYGEGRVLVLLLTGLQLVAVLCLSALRVERHGSWWSLADDVDRYDLRALLGAAAFVRDAQDQLERSSVVGGRLHLVLAEINDLDAVNGAYGRLAGDAALAHVAGVLRTHVPATALLGHLGTGLFAVLTPEPADKIVAAIRTGLIDVPPGPQQELRVDASFGTAQGQGVVDVQELLARARQDLRAART